ncbi:hypothetical protein [Rathayibacter sp. VKM Ac-2878]|uniref:hypothetical protein n=1 Tax=Rathayibacter sp. VKM Ac-2878 TaxID=2783831 RepID=UPI00188BD320|nr:hypothetical protein [Rathayibacter sp. VKM Ac-2878]MBF4461144.1 hypothetical protein [Rathayibacter sp. VKM Ac-2879]
MLIAKHCADFPNAQVKVAGQLIGEVAWRAPDDDLALVRVEPTVRRHLDCNPGSDGGQCHIQEQVFPRALGRVFLNERFGEQAVPMRAAALPGGNETFCTSGSSTGVNCSWTPVRTPSDGFSPGEAAAAFGTGIGVIVGDSGGPVIGTQGQFYGIIVKRGINRLQGLMAYIPSDRVFRALPYYYTIAEPN